ncbi:MAG: hypothetical protein K6B64_00175 [Acholeplasmatales bacterium]|nr:hypothetical protein [Acholeplasmatales bacterium]
MATIKRKKVSTAKAAKQKKNLLKNKLFWIISSIAIVLIAAGIIIPIVIVNNQNSTTEQTDYFANTHTYAGNEITFKKANFEGIIMHTSEVDFETEEGFATYQKHIFFFAFNLSNFYADNSMDTDETKYFNSIHKEALTSMLKLQNAINNYNNAILNDNVADNDDEVAYLYVIDLSKGNNASTVSSSYSDYFGCSDGQSFAFGYINGVNKLVKEYKLNDVAQSVYTNDMNEFNTTVCDNSIAFMNDYNFKTNN